MWKGESVYTGIKIIANKDYEDGFATNTKKENIILNHESYNRREKVFINNIRVDTKPLVINSISNNSDDTSKVKDFKFSFQSK